KPLEPQDENPVAENVKMLMGQPADALPDQDQVAHMRVLIDVMISPYYGQNPLFSQRFLPLALEHLAQHMAFWYAKAVMQLAGSASNIPDIGSLSKDPQVAGLLANVVAEADPIVLNQANVIFNDQAKEAYDVSVLEVIQQSQQLLQSLGPQAGADPVQM